MNNIEISSDSDNEQEEVVVKYSLRDDLKQKFDKLKEKREKLVQKGIKKEEKLKSGKRRRRKSVEKTEIEDIKKHVLNYDKNIKNLDWNQLNDDTSERISLENDLNQAIKSSNIKLAEEFNEKLIDHDSIKTINYAVDAYKFENKVKSNEKPKKLKWQFEAKEKWQSKSNM
jgi:hypothetical protein